MSQLPTLVFATNNAHKVFEINAVVTIQYKVVTLGEAGISIDIPEPYETLEENAQHKCRTIHKLVNRDCFSEDTGLEVKALNGEPGVKSARYAGDEKNFNANIHLLLANLTGTKHREARFRTVICLIMNDEEFLFQGICQGTIIDNPRGTNGFGYDPVFVPDGSDKTFAEMSLAEKNEYSHRRKAVDELITFLKLRHG